MKVNMKAKYYQLISLCLLWAAALCTACTDDAVSPFNPLLPEPDDGLPQVADGQFVVSYGTSEAVSRALSTDTLPANKRISSLHYFVYDATSNNLIKMRKIRGINDSTHWPISSREEVNGHKMPWDLRQDLQDTLMAGPKYLILFIANIDSTLFTLPDGTQHPALVRNVEKYTSAKILLPKVPFSDNNMYYMWEDTLQVTSKTTVKRNDVKLQRLVTRTDVRREEIDLKKELYKVVANKGYEKMAKMLGINDKIDKHVDEFCGRMIKKMTGDYKQEASQLTTLLKSQETKDTLHKAFKELFVKQYTESILSSGLSRRIGLWPKTGLVTAHYLKGSRANVLSFDRKAYKDEQMNQSEVLELTDGKFTIIGFSGSEANSQNGITNLLFQGSDPNSTFEISNDTLWLKGGLNTRHKVKCNPVNSVYIDVSDKTPKKKTTLNFMDALKNIPDWVTLSQYKGADQKKTFFEMAKDRVFNSGFISEDYSEYGVNFSNFLFSNFLIPDITVDNADKIVTVYPSWIYE